MIIACLRLVVVNIGEIVVNIVDVMLCSFMVVVLLLSLLSPPQLQAATV